MVFRTLSLSAVVAALLTIPYVAEASFQRDVQRVVNVRKTKTAAEDALLAKAVPLDEYRANLRSAGHDIRRVEEEANEDDYYMNENYMYSFSGYSLKYAECQPVQRFSEDAIEAGEYTPMTTNDIVILRLCPTDSCSSSSTYGCKYNYAEYAIDVNDYVRIMLRYKMDKREKLCEWCEACAGGRRLEDNAEEQDAEEAADGDDNVEEEANDDANENGDEEGDDAAAEQDDGYWNDDYSENCDNYQTYCYDDNGYGICEDNEDDGNGSFDPEDYMDYVNGCTNVQGYYVRPRCDAYKKTISMAIFYDPFCSQFAGNEVSINKLNLGFQQSAFEEFYATGECIDCSENDYAPFFNANSTLCNRMHASGAVCSSSLNYDLYDVADSEDTACSFIESIHYGTYDEEGRLYSESSMGNTIRKVTSEQKAALVIILVVCALLGLYSCYLHHAITNLLVMSLSHTDLLPSRNRSRNRRSRSSRRRVMNTDEEEDNDGWVVKKRGHR